MLIDNQNTFITLSTLANHFNLPKGYLKKLADKSSIPSLNVNGHRRFNLEAVQQALNKLAEQKTSDFARLMPVGELARGRCLVDG